MLLNWNLKMEQERERRTQGWLPPFDLLNAFSITISSDLSLSSFVCKVLNKAPVQGEQLNKAHVQGEQLHTAHDELQLRNW